MAAPTPSPGRTGSAPPPVWSSLLAEGRRALDRVLGGEHRADDLALLAPEGPVVPGALRIEDRLRGRRRERRVRRDLRGQLECDLQRLTGLGQSVDQSELRAA